jgi:general secretion pathway protein K
MSRALRQRGAVVIVAMLIVAVAATAAGFMLEQQDVSVRQFEAGRDYEQARWILKGGTHWARWILEEDARSTGVDHGGELWASGLPLTDVESGTLSGEISDQQGLFNLNNLVRNGKPSATDIAALKRMLQAIGLRAELADAMAEGIDATRPLLDIGELAGRRGVDAAAIARLRQYATALPLRTPVNVNTAPPEVLVAIVEGLTLPEALVLAKGRSAAPMRNRDEFFARLRRDLSASVEDISVESRFFLVSGQAKIGKADVRMQALLQRTGAGLPAIVWQRMS